MTSRSRLQIAIFPLLFLACGCHWSSHCSTWRGKHTIMAWVHERLSYHGAKKMEDQNQLFSVSRKPPRRLCYSREEKEDPCRNEQNIATPSQGRPFPQCKIQITSEGGWVFSEMNSASATQVWSIYYVVGLCKWRKRSCCVCECTKDNLLPIFFFFQNCASCHRANLYPKLINKGLFVNKV